jgi:ADP-dependent NAD(P)H-hydrate dehydratase / NAD(P)H-hydrate epimerase
MLAMQTIKSPIYQTQQIREFERLALERFGLSGQILMQRAGKAAFDFLLRRWPQAQKITVCCGGGNNGGDGYVLAEQAHERGLKVTIWQVGKLDSMKPEAKEALEACVKSNIPMQIFDANMDMGHPDVIVDAICGIGLHDNLREDVVAVIEKMQRSHSPILALDIPTGIDADTGYLLGAAVRATATITFIGLKLGLLTGNGIAYTGELVLNDLQFPSELFSYVTPMAEKIHFSAYAHYLNPRPRDWHKGLSGHVLIIGGDVGFSGAPRMAAEAALRVGAGLVSVATRPENAVTMNATCPEIMCHGVNNAKELLALIEKADILVVGPGLGQSAWADMLFTCACEQKQPLIVDADGLNLLSSKTMQNDHWVLTPHPGEAGRLLGETADVIQQDRLSAIKAINKRYGGVCVLKGAGSLVYAPHALPGICDKGNPGMASAGMGDVLSGVIAGLASQGVPLGDAAALGVCIHAMAGDLAAKEGERGIVAMDLMPFLKRLCNPAKNE